MNPEDILEMTEVIEKINAASKSWNITKKTKSKNDFSWGNTATDWFTYKSTEYTPPTPPTKEQEEADKKHQEAIKKAEAKRKVAEAKRKAKAKEKAQRLFEDKVADKALELLGES